jgi:hypothetical protein
MPLLLALWSRDRFRLAEFLSDNCQSFLCPLFAWNIRPEFPLGVMKALAFIRGFAGPVTDDPSDIVDQLLSQTVPTDAIVAALDPTYASKDVPDQFVLMCCAVMKTDLTDTRLATLLREANFIPLLVRTASRVQSDVKKTAVHFLMQHLPSLPTNEICDLLAEGLIEILAEIMDELSLPDASDHVDAVAHMLSCFDRGGLPVEKIVAAVATLKLPDKLSQMQDCEWPTREKDYANIQVIVEWLDQFGVESQVSDPSQQYVE